MTIEEQKYWKEERKRCEKSPYYFFTKYVTINGDPATTHLDENTFNKNFRQGIVPTISLTTKDNQS